MKRVLPIAVCAMIFCVMPAGVRVSIAEDAAGGLTLGHDRFSQAEPDPKAPAPSVLGAKFGFGGSDGFKPYVGTGVAYTLLPEAKPGDPLRYKTGMAAQAGATYRFNKNLSLSVDYKYLYIQPEAQHGESKPQSIGIGVNIKF